MYKKHITTPEKEYLYITSCHIKTIGATQNVIKSEIESSSIPKKLVVFFALATTPSKPSNIIPKIISQEDFTKSPFILKIIDQKPQNIFPAVKIVGKKYKNVFIKFP
jgi:hypothetical protein